MSVDEHACRHTHRRAKYVTVLIDLTGPRPHRTGVAAGHSESPIEAGVKAWSDRDEIRRNAVAIVSMDGFTGLKTAAIEELKDDVMVVMDPFYVVGVRHEALCVTSEVKDRRRRDAAASR